MIKHSFRDFKVGKEFDFGVKVLSEDEIIKFAMNFDPLDFHIDREAGTKSPFKSIIASGPHIFTVVHKEFWIPMFKDTVLAGLEVNNWKFLKPVYPEMKVFGKVTIEKISENPEKGVGVVTWKYQFMDEFSELVQSLEMVVMHYLNK